MMKKILILIYIMAVLALSGMVKADQHGRGIVRTASITLDGILTAEGVLSTPCDSNPKIIKAQIDESRHSLSLIVDTQFTGELCSDSKQNMLFNSEEVVTKHFTVVFDLKSFALSSGHVYDVSFADMSGTRTALQYRAIAGNSTDADYELDKKDFKGFLIASQDGSVVLKNSNETVPVMSPDMIPQLSSLVGEVHLTGYAVSIATLNDDEIDSLAPSSQGNNTTQVIVPVSGSVIQ